MSPLTPVADRLLRLTPECRNALDLLFVAAHAPEIGAPPPPMHPAHGLFPFYNHELMKTVMGLGVRCTPCKDLDALPDLLPRHNYAFSIFNRAPFRNCELYVSLMCERHGVAYMGAPPNIRALAEDKHATKWMAVGLGIPTAPWRTYMPHQPMTPPDFAGPYIVKPRFGAASEEITVASIQDDWVGMEPRVRDLLDRGKECMVERCIAGTDLTVPVLGGMPPVILGVAEEVSELPSGISTYRQKRLLETPRVRRVLDDPTVVAEVEGYVSRFCAQVRPFDYIRVDWRLERGTGRVYLLEFNVCCNLGSHAAVVFAGRRHGLEQADIVEHILAHSLSRQTPLQSSGVA